MANALQVIGLNTVTPQLEAGQTSNLDTYSMVSPLTINPSGTAGYSGTNALTVTGNVSANALYQGTTNQAATTSIQLTASSVTSWIITGSGGQTIILPDATTLPVGAMFTFNNNQSSGAITVNVFGSGSAPATVQSGGYATVTLLTKSVAAGTWDVHYGTPSNVTWSTNTFNYPGAMTGLTSLAFNGSTSGKVTVSPAAVAGTWTFTLPTTAGTSGYLLQTNGSGVTSWSPNGSIVIAPSGDVTGATDWTNINNAITTLNSATGGVIQLLAGNYYLNAYLPLVNNVIIKGVGWSASGVASSTLIGGTILNGNGTFPAFYVVGTAGGSSSQATLGDLGSPQANLAALFAGQTSGCGVQDMALQNFSFGIKAGALYNIGVVDSKFRNVLAISCTNWGFWFENFDDCDFYELKAQSNVNGMRFAASGTTIYNFGDSAIYRPNFYGNQSAAGMPGIGFSLRTRGASSQLNDIHIFSCLGSSSAAFTSTQACTATASSTSLGVTDLSKFAVDMPVVFTSTANGFTLNVCYFVLSVSGTTGAGTITVGNQIGGTAIAATGATAFNIYTAGFHLFEATTDGASNGHVTTTSVSGNLDLEGGGTVRMVVAGGSGCSFECGNLTTGATITSIVGRSSLAVQFNCAGGSTISVDFDSQNFGVNGGSGISHVQNFLGVGLIRPTDANGTGGLNLAGKVGYDMAYNNTSNLVTFPSRAFAAYSGFATTTGTVFYQSETFSGAAGITRTLPTITSNFVGYLFMISNPTANSVTYQTGGSQNIIGLGVSGTSITLATLTSAILCACNNNGTFFWARYA